MLGLCSADTFEFEDVSKHFLLDFLGLISSLDKVKLKKKKIKIVVIVIYRHILQQIKQLFCYFYRTFLQVFINLFSINFHQKGCVRRSVE